MYPTGRIVWQRDLLVLTPPSLMDEFLVNDIVQLWQKLAWRRDGGHDEGSQLCAISESSAFPVHTQGRVLPLKTAETRALPATGGIDYVFFSAALNFFARLLQPRDTPSIPL